MNFEDTYVNLIDDIINNGAIRNGRNGKTLSIFGIQMHTDILKDNKFPLLLAREMYYNGVFGELAAFFRGPHHVNDFKEHGCNYWDKWADEDGKLTLDYGNAWLDQLDLIIEGIKVNPHGRRHLITGWVPENLNKLSLPCCHYAYQWYVTDDGYLDMIWIQRSVDLLIGLPSDIILAAVWNILMAHLTDYMPGRLTFQLGDVHIYEEHLMPAFQYMKVYKRHYKLGNRFYPSFTLNTDINFINEFLPSHISIKDYNPSDPINFLLKE